MIKDLVQYTDIDGQQASKTVFFNLTQYEIEAEIELEILEARFRKFQEEVIGDDPNAPIRDMTGPEKREMLSLVKLLVQHSYGIREGKRFVKNKEIWDEFVQTGAFSAYIYQLFQKPDAANTFMMGIWPQGASRPAEYAQTQTLQVVPDVAPDAPDATDGWIVKDSLGDYSEGYLLRCPEGEFTAIMNHFTNGKNVPFQLLVVGQKRMSGPLDE